jgi:pimeloyl-ACP methyl ester carboxylesterase
MQDKYTYGLWGAAAGAVVLAIVGFTWGGWYTASGAAKHAEAAASDALVPVCAGMILADPAAVAELKVKRPIDYDDVVRNHLKTVGNLTDLSYQFRRDCGKAIEAMMAKTAAKS